MKKEVWKDIKGYEKFYMVSSYGRVKSLSRTIKHPYSNNGGYKKGKILKQQLNTNNYYRVYLCKYGVKKRFYVHRLVISSFLPNPLGKLEINHINENRKDNRLENLEWSTKKENMRHGTIRERISKKLSKPVIQKTLDGVFLKRWNSVSETSRIGGYNLSSVSKCCREKSKSHKNYKWSFE